jgi:hypothetical protein
MSTLKGHSGCFLELIDFKNNQIVRKKSMNIDYNVRLESQCKKQSDFKHKNIKTPKVISSGYEKGLFYFDMEYVRGVRFSDFIIKNSFEKSKFIFDSLLAFVKENKTDSHKLISSEIVKKIKSINDSYEIDRYTLDFLERFSKDNVLTGYCHGDLTFENIIISNDEIYLIDFLDNYIETPYQDLSKLFQELNLFWSFRDSEINALTYIKYNHLKKRLMSFVWDENLSTNNSLRVQVIINMLRILPYATETKIIHLLNKQIYKEILK